MRGKKGKENIKCTLQHSTINRLVVKTSNAPEGGMIGKAICEYCLYALNTRLSLTYSLCTHILLPTGNKVRSYYTTGEPKAEH